MGGDFTVNVVVEGKELNDVQRRVLDAYEEVIELFIRKNENYNSSFENSAKIESIMRHGSVEPEGMFDIVAKQIYVRGFLDKMSRFYELQFNEGSDQVGESLYDTLLDLGNYAIMLASLYAKYEGHPSEDPEEV